MEKMNNKPWDKAHRIALGGVSEKAMLYYLDQHPEIEKVYLCLDGDEPGQEATNKLCQVLTQKGFSDENILIETSMGKDWNEDLLSLRADMQEQDQGL